MAKFTYSCDSEGFVLEIDSNQRTYEIKGPVSQTGRIMHHSLNIDAYTQLFFCENTSGVSLFLVDRHGSYEVFDFDATGKTTHRFYPQIGRFGQDATNDLCAGKFLGLTCCTLNNSTTQGIFVAMQEDVSDINIYTYSNVGGAFSTTGPNVFNLTSAFNTNDSLELVDLNCCGSNIQVIAKNKSTREYVSASFNPLTNGSLVLLGVFDPNLDYSAIFVRSFCCQGEYFVVFSLNGQNILYESRTLTQLGHLGTDTTSDVFVNLNSNNPIEYRTLGEFGDQFVTLTCCAVNGETDLDIVIILKAPSGQYQFYILNPDGSETDATAIRFGIPTDHFVSITCCAALGEIFVTLKDANNQIKLFGFNSVGGLIGGDFLTGLKINLTQCRAEASLQIENVYIFQNDIAQNYLFITRPDGTPITCPQAIGSRYDTVQSVSCCDRETSTSYPYTVASRMILVVLQDSSTSQLYLHMFDTLNPSALINYAYTIGYPGDQIVHMQCCDFISDTVSLNAGSLVSDNDVFIVLKTPQGSFKLEVYNNANGGREVYGHTNPKAFGMNGDSFFSLACCGQGDARKLFLVLKTCDSYSVYSFVEGPLQTLTNLISTNVQLVWTLFQESITTSFVQETNESILFVLNTAFYRGSDAHVQGVSLNSLTSPWFLDPSKAINVLFTLAKDGSIKLCPVVLPNGKIKNVTECDIDGNGLPETVIVLEDTKGVNRIVILSSTGTVVAGISGRTLGKECEEFVKFMYCDINGDGRSELVFLMRHRRTCEYTLYVMNSCGSPLFCRRIECEGLRFISMECCPVRGEGTSDIMLVFRDRFHAYTLFAYNFEGRRYYLFDLQYKRSDNDVMFRYNVGYHDRFFKIYRVHKSGKMIHCPKICQRSSIEDERRDDRY